MLGSASAGTEREADAYGNENERNRRCALVRLTGFTDRHRRGAGESLEKALLRQLMIAGKGGRVPEASSVRPNERRDGVPAAPRKQAKP